MLDILSTVLLICIGTCNADVYMHNPRGSNNRLNENTRPRRNAKRLFDSQNNKRGGYNVGSASQDKTSDGRLYYYTGSVLNIEWTNQHSCAEQNSHCEVIIQYMCDDRLRDGTVTSTIPSKLQQCKDGDCNTDTKYGMHENYDYYTNCNYRYRNKGLFLINKIRSNRATRTRQNPAGTRYGYECAEERDYYPYWQPSPWRDVAVITNNVSRCDMYLKESHNTKSRFSCVPPTTYIRDIMEKGKPPGKLLPLNKEECEKVTYKDESFKWVETNAFGIPPPSCFLGPRNRDNHLGDGVDGFPNMFNWTIPNTPHEHCALRLRYNISTDDYDPWNTTYGSNIDIGRLVGIDNNEDAKARGYVFKDNPQVQPLAKTINGKDLGAKLKLQLAINTNQYGRTFQDRSHSFSIRQRPDELKNAKIRNINVRGVRGNIVQVYPSVEYDYVPNRVMAGVGDYIHFQWTGSNTNNKNNDGQGRKGTDRNNVAVLRQQNYPEGTSVPVGRKSGHWGNNYPAHLDNVTFLGISRPDLERILILKPGQSKPDLSELDSADPYFDLGPKKITSSAGIYHYMCTRNNNFSNRSQKGKIVVSRIQFSEEVLGWSGGKVVIGDGEQGVCVNKGLIQGLRRIHVEEWIEKDARELMESSGGYIKEGEQYKSNFLAIFPFDNLVDSAEATVKIKVSGEDIAIYHSLDYVYWRKMARVDVQGSVAAFQTTTGGIYVARESKISSQPTLIIAIVVVFLIVAILTIGTILYRRRTCAKDFRNAKRILRSIPKNMDRNV